MRSDEEKNADMFRSFPAILEATATGAMPSTGDVVEWEVFGLRCAAVFRSIPGMGSFWCGYVAVPAGHALHGMDYNDVQADYDFPVHGDLTYGDDLVAAGGPITEPKGSWWFGFDTGHYNSGHWSREMIVDEVERLAALIATLEVN